jgi:hypothetical protein
VKGRTDMPDHKNITKLSDEQKIFILEEKPLKANFFVLWHRQQVSMGEVWMLYQDGNLHKELHPGPHVWFNGFFHEWRIQRINQNIELIPIEVKGRVRGPSMEKEKKEPWEANDETALAGVGDFACEVTANLGLSCGITRFETFLRYRDPLSIFLASVSNMVHEIIGTLPYDKYGRWATLLRDEVKQRLQFTDSSEKLVGMTIEDVFVTGFQPNTRHDRNMLEMYQQRERAERELLEAKDHSKRDRVVAESYAEQGGIMNISPALLALQNSPIGKALIERDADLKKLAVAAGLNPGVNIQAIPDPQRQAGGDPSIGYLQPARDMKQLPPSSGAPANFSRTDAISGSLSFPNANANSNSGAFSFPNANSNAGAFAPQTMPPAFADAETPIEQARQEQELTELTNAGFQCAGRGQFNPVYENGQPVPGSKTWILEVYASRPDGGYLTLVFHCPMGYPLKAPRVQMRSASAGGFRWIEPNAVRNWHPATLLATIAREINDSVLD